MNDVSDIATQDAVYHELLRERQLRVTPQRVAVLKAVHTLSHPDAEDVYRLLAGHYPSLSVATIYNTLDRLEQENLVSVIQVDGRRRYDHRTDRHYHLQCTRCDRLADVTPDDVGGPDPVAPDGGEDWTIFRMAVLWTGLCPECRADGARD